MSNSFRSARLVFGGLMISLLLATGGCSVSQSFGSASDSSGSFSDSSGSSSDSSTSSSGDDSAYRGDVSAYTVAHVEAGGSPESLRSGLSEVALSRGISDWEALPGTFAAVGAGLAEAGVSPDGLSAFQLALASPGTPAYDAIGAAYATTSR